MRNGVIIGRKLMSNGLNISRTELLTFEEVVGFYIFADIRGFSKWANDNHGEVGDLLNIMYPLAYQYFGGRTRQKYLMRVVKFLGDGFFAVREYNGQRLKSFERNLFLSITSMIDFKRSFLDELSSSILHEKDKLGISFGLSYGKSKKFNFAGFPKDYTGDKINLSSRFCSVAKASEFVIEYDLKKDICSFEADGYFNLISSKGTKRKLKGFGNKNVFIVNEISRR